MNVETIRQNLTANGLETRVVLNACALSRSPGHGVINTTVARDAFSGYLEDVSPCTIKGSVPVTTLTDRQSHGIRRIDALKIDAEGHETEILAGASQLLADDGIGIIILETAPEQLTFYSFLREKRFHFFDDDVLARKLNPITPATRKNLESMEPTPFSSNIVLVHESRLSEVSLAIGRSDTP